MTTRFSSKPSAIITVILTVALISVIPGLSSCKRASITHGLQDELTEFVKDKDATIGIAVIINGRDTVAVNADRPFPMLSVYKLPIVMALGEQMQIGNRTISDTITITASELQPDTYSPMLDLYAGMDTIQLSVLDIISYALQQSDNNASDIILNIIGGPERAMLALDRLGIMDINISITEAEMYDDRRLCYRNSATPIALARMLEQLVKFDDDYSRRVREIIEDCRTGENRLAKPLAGTGAVIGHKTGTGFTLPDGRLMAINDAGYVKLPDGTTYTIAVLIENSGYDLPATEELIAEISSRVYHHITRR